MIFLKNKNGRGIYLTGRFLFFIAALFASGPPAQAQSLVKKFCHLSRPEKGWVIAHPFIARKTFRLTQEALAVAGEIRSDTSLDGEINGGQADAFRHSYWMAFLSQHIKPGKAHKLGVAHEKGNTIDFRKHYLEEGLLPDSVSCLMDLLNNEAGICIGKNNPSLSKQELKELVKKELLSGKFRIIRKDVNGNFLDCNGRIIPPEQWKGKWGIPKCLISSDVRVRH